MIDSTELTVLETQNKNKLDVLATIEKQNNDIIVNRLNKLEERDDKLENIFARRMILNTLIFIFILIVIKK